jgi:Ca2+-binding EF-hand superfamily protein
VRNGPRRVPLFAVRLFNFLDTDRSAKLSREEFGELARLFNSLDTDHDELLSTKELCHFFDAPNEASL